MKRILLLTLYILLAFGVGFGIAVGVFSMMGGGSHSGEEMVEHIDGDSTAIHEEHADEGEHEAHAEEPEKKEKIANEGKEESSVLSEVVEEVNEDDGKEKNNAPAITSEEAEKMVEKHQEQRENGEVEKQLAEKVEQKEEVVVEKMNLGIPPVAKIYADLEATVGSLKPKKKDKNFAFIKKEKADLAYIALSPKSRAGNKSKVESTFKVNKTIAGYTYHTGKKKYVPSVAIRYENISEAIVSKSINIEAEFVLNGEIYDRISSKVNYNDSYYLVPAFFHQKTHMSKNGIKSMKHAIKDLKVKVFINDVLVAEQSVDTIEVLDWSFN